MRVWLIGAGKSGIKALVQLKKDGKTKVFISSPSVRPKAVIDGVIEQVNYVEHVTPLNINLLAKRIRPDLILIDSGAKASHLGRFTGGLALSEAM
ncbi:MAG: hypothetical protein AAF639_20260, partial [Chloroflexota bacterium]